VKRRCTALGTFCWRASVSGPRETGVRHEGTDEDGDGEADGIKVYQFMDSDEAGTWRVLWTGSDKCGIHSRYRRTHDAPHMLVANERCNRHWGVVCEGNSAGREKPQGSPQSLASYLRRAGYVVPGHRVLDEPSTAFVLMDRWVGMRLVAEGMTVPDASLRAIAMHYSGHGGGLGNVGRNAPYHIMNYGFPDEENSPPHWLEINAHPRFDSGDVVARYAQFRGCSTANPAYSSNFAESCHERGIETTVGFAESVGGGWCAKLWTEKFYGYALPIIDGHAYTIGTASEKAKQYFIDNVVNPTVPENHEYYHYGYDSVKLYGNGSQYLQASE